jgi:hypothetical protein
MDDEIEILPHIMIILLMEVKALVCIPIKLLFINIANETSVLHVFVTSLSLISELGKSINNNTKDNVEQNCNNQKEEGEIHYTSEVESLNIFFCSRLSWQELSNSSSTSNSIVDSREEAMHHCHTN